MRCRSGHAAWMAAVLASAAAFACKDGDDSGSASGTSGAGAVQRAADVRGLAAIPAEVEVVIGANVPRLAASELVRRGVRGMLARDPELDTRVLALVNACDLDPAEDLERVVIGMGDGPDRVILVAEGRFDDSRLAACVGKSMDEAGGSLSTASYRGRRLYHAESTDRSSDVWFALGDDDTLVVASSRGFLERALGDGAKLPDRDAVAGLVSRAGPEHDLWMAGRMRPEIGQGLVETTGGEVEKPPEAVFGHAQVGAGVRAEIGVIMASPADASRAVAFAEPQLDALALVAQKHGFGRLVKHVSISADEATVALRADLDAAELREALSPIDSQGEGEENPASQ